MVDTVLRHIAVAAAAYVIGSVPFAFIWTLVFKRRDLRRLGTGNITVYNSFKNAGWAPAAMTVVSNAGLGFGVVVFSRWMAPGSDLSLLVALVCVTVGANWPVWLAFSGGKGTTTMGWTMLFIAPQAVFAVLGVWFAVLVVTRRTFTSSTVVYRTLPIILGLVTKSWRFAVAGLVLSVVLHMNHNTRKDDSLHYRLGGWFGVNRT